MIVICMLIRWKNDFERCINKWFTYVAAHHELYWAAL